MSQKFLDESVLPLARTIYDEDLSCNGLCKSQIFHFSRILRRCFLWCPKISVSFLAFAGFAALLSASSKVYTTKGGNDVFVKTLLKASNATVSLSSRVTEVEKKSGIYVFPPFMREGKR